MHSTIGAPLKGIRIVEFEGIGPGPTAAHMLAGMGAEVIAIVRPAAKVAVVVPKGKDDEDALRQFKKIVEIDLKSSDGIARAMDLVASADGLIEGNRPGVME